MPAPGGPKEVYDLWEERYNLTKGPEGIYMRPSDRPGFGWDIVVVYATQDFCDDAAADVGQLLVAAGVQDGEPVLIEPHQVQQRGVDVAHRDLVDRRRGPRNHPSRRTWIPA